MQKVRQLRKTTYTISAVAVGVFFLSPDPVAGVAIALVLQTLAFITIAGRSPLDGLLLTGISFLLMGSLSPDHPILAGADSYGAIRVWLITAGIATVVFSSGLLYHRNHS